jgi:cytochrome c oxidase assembly factor CtaG
MSYLSKWSYDPFIVVVAIMVLVHEIGLRNLSRRSRSERTRQRRVRSYYFYAGLAVLLLAVISPIDYWASDYFFVHMIEHILIMFYAPMLVVAGAPWLVFVHALPVRQRRSLLRALLLSKVTAPLRAVGRFLSSGWFAVLFFNVVMLVWHIPSLFNLSESNQFIHIWIMHASFFVSGVLFWLQIIPSYPVKMKLRLTQQVGAILVTNVTMIFLAMSMSILTAHSWYATYSNIPGISFSPFADQQIGAAILWVCGDFWALPILIVLIRRIIEKEGSVGMAFERMVHRNDPFAVDVPDPV